MICAVNIKTEYGRQGTIGINLMSELSSDGNMAYAHSMEQAIAWAKSHKAFADVEPCDLHDGRFVLTSEWWEKNTMLNILYGDDGATHERQSITVYPVSTVFESTGYVPAVYSSG